MCIIIDASVMADFFINSDNSSCDRLFKAVSTATPNSAVLVYGGKLTREYAASGEVLRVLRVLDANGRARQVADPAVDTEESVVRQLGICTSDDEHVVALARVSGARLLCSDDSRLKTDFKDRRLVSQPRGKVYKRDHHDPLIRHTCRKVR